MPSWKMRGVGIAEPVILDQVFGHDVRGQHRRAGTRSAGVAQAPVGNQGQIAGLRRKHLHAEAAGDLVGVEHHVELGLHFAIDQIKQHGIGIDGGGARLVAIAGDHLRDRGFDAVDDGGGGADGVVCRRAAICAIAPMYCVVVGELRLVSLPFHSATSWVSMTPLTVSTRSLACR